MRTNRSGDGGLYAEMLINRAFDDGVIPTGCTYDSDSKTITSPTGWVSGFNCAETKGGSIANLGYGGVAVKANSTYRFYMFAKSEKNVNFTAELMSESGSVYAQRILTVKGGYAKYECILESSADDNNTVLSLSSPSADTVTIGFTSLMPTDTFMKRENGLRKDLAERLIALKPAFLRFPGGCIVEGFSKETAHRFEDTIGNVWERKPHWLL